MGCAGELNVLFESAAMETSCQNIPHRAAREDLERCPCTDGELRGADANTCGSHTLISSVLILNSVTLHFIERNFSACFDPEFYCSLRTGTNIRLFRYRFTAFMVAGKKEKICLWSQEKMRTTSSNLPVISRAFVFCSPARKWISNLQA